MIQQQNHSEICPVCKGSGKYREYSNYSGVTYIEKTCHGCQGKGWVIVPDTKEISWSSYSSTGEPQTFNMEKAIEEHTPNIM